MKVRVDDPDEEQVSPLEQTNRHDLDFEMNNRIQWWIKRFTGPDRKHFRHELANFDKVRPTMEKIFAGNGIPKDLVYLCMIESGGRPNAISPAGATGYWQFTADTAKSYKLTVNSWVDERRDIVKSTQAAARYLKSLYAIFNDWLLAGAAYNAGEGNLYRIMKSHPEINTYWDISHHMPIKHETLDYIPKLIATIVLAKNRAYYGLDAADKKNTLAYETVPVPSKTYLKDIAELLGVPHQEIALLNADLVRQCTPPTGKTHELKVPEGTADTVARYVENLGERKKKGRKDDGDKEEKEPAAKADKPKNGKHIVKEGENLFRIALSYSVTLKSLKEANGLGESNEIAIGQELVIPGGGADDGEAQEDKPAKAAKDDSGKKESGKRKGAGEGKEEKPRKKDSHEVEKGETLKGIAQDHHTTVDAIMELNDIGNPRGIKPGMVLNIPPKDKDRDSFPKDAKEKETLYKVKKGDTAWSISKKLGVAVEDLLKWNGLKRGSVITPGDELKIRK